MFTVFLQGSNRLVTKKVKQGGGTMGDTAPLLRLRGGGMMGDSGSSSSSSDEDAYMSAAEELSLSPTPHDFETPDNHSNGELADEGAGVSDKPR